MKIALDVAENEFIRFAENMDLISEQEEYKNEKEIIIKAICNGSLTINEDGEPVFTPQRSKVCEPLTFREPDGATVMAMDKKKKGEEIGKLFSVMGDICKVHPNTFAKMAWRDLKVPQAIVTLFLA